MHGFVQNFLDFPRKLRFQDSHIIVRTCVELFGLECMIAMHGVLIGVYSSLSLARPHPLGALWSLGHILCLSLWVIWGPAIWECSSHLFSPLPASYSNWGQTQEPKKNQKYSVRVSPSEVGLQGIVGPPRPFLGQLLPPGSVPLSYLVSLLK